MSDYDPQARATAGNAPAAGRYDPISSATRGNVTWMTWFGWCALLPGPDLRAQAGGAIEIAGSVGEHMLVGRVQS
jgi:hypothetical protein